MAWYDNILSWFKNTPSNVTITKADNETNINWWSSPIQVSPSVQGTQQGTPTTQTTQTPKVSWVDRALDTIFPISTSSWENYIDTLKTQTIYNTNKDKTKFETEWFSLDPYNVSQWLDSSDSPVDHSVDIEKSDSRKWFDILWKAFVPKLSKITKWEELDTWDMFDIATDVAVNYFNEEVNLWQEIDPKAIPNAISNWWKYWWEWEYQTEYSWGPVTIQYESPNKQEFNYDLSLYNMYNDAYSQWLLWETTWENTKDAFYDKYKSWFWVKWWYHSWDDDLFSGWNLSRDHFFWFVDNELAKQWALSEQVEESKLMKIFQDTQAETRQSQLTQYATNKVWEAVQNSLISTVEARQEFMNDAVANASDTFWRWNNVMYWAYHTKAHLQRLYNTTDLSQVTMTPEHQVIYEDILWWEKALDQFVKNYTEWMSLMPDYVNPSTWKIDRMPDAIVDPSTWETISYRDFLFKGIDMEGRWLPHTLQEVQSPQDVLDYNTRFIRLRIENLEDWFLEKMWNYSQYWLSLWVGAPVNELSQQTIWRWIDLIWDIISKESWEVPFAFTDMDTSIMASMTTNKSSFWRLVQNYLIKSEEYVPELVGQIWFNYYLGKWLNNMWELAQIRSLWALNKVNWVKNSVGGQQFAQTVAYAPRVLQLIWTDQTIDAIASIWDTESLSDFSKVLSIWWTFLWEWIWILKDLKVLNKSLLMNFSKSARNSWWLTDPIRLIADNPHILDNYAAQIWRWTVDESWKIVWDQYKLLLQDLNQYAKWLKKMSDAITQSVKTAVNNWIDISRLNQDVKQAAYNVLKQVFRQDSAMARDITNMLTDQRVNIADMVKYIWWIDWAVKVWPWVSTIKLTDNLGDFVSRTVKNYNPWADIIVEWWLVSWINRWLTKSELEELWAQWIISQAAMKDIEDNLWEYFTMVRDWDEIKYYPTEKWLSALWVESSVVANPLAIAAMSDDTRELIDKIKSLPANQKKLNDNLLEQIWETNAIDTLARNIADIDILDICK